MKIAIFTDLFLPRIDGVSNSLAHLVKEYARQGHDVLVVAPKLKGCDQVEIDGVDIVFLPSIVDVFYPTSALGMFSPYLLKKLKSFSPEIIHVVVPLTVGGMGLLYSKLVDIKSVAVFHAYFMEPEYLKIIGIKNRGVGVAQKMLWKYAKSFYDRANYVVTPSNFVKQDLIAHNFSGPIKVINNAIDFSNVSFDQKKHLSFIKEHSLLNNKIALYIGRISIEKNIELLIDSFSDVLKKVPDAKLLIVGGGPDLERLQNKVAQLNLEKHIVFSGEIKNYDLVRKGVFRLAKVFVTASHSEVQPVSIIEAMSFGLPVVAAKSRGLTEMIKDNGYLVSNDDKNKFSENISKILRDTKTQKEMSERSRQLAKKYSLSNSAKKHISLYKKLIKKNESVSFIRRVFKRKK